MGPNWIALPIAKLGKVYQIGNDDSFQTELAENVNQITGGRHDFVGTRKNEGARPEAPQVISRFSAAVVNQSLAAAKFREEPCGRGGYQE
jgi:hypothetical protein